MSVRIGRCLSSDELVWVQVRASTLLARGFLPDRDDCLRDPQFAAIDPRWQALIVSDMDFVLRNPLDAGVVR